MTIPTGVVHRYPLPRALFQRLSFHIHLDAMRTLLALLWFKVGLSQSFHQVIPADLPSLSATETTSTTWTSCDHFIRTFLCVLTPCCLAEWPSTVKRMTNLCILVHQMAKRSCPSADEASKFTGTSSKSMPESKRVHALAAVRHDKSSPVISAQEKTQSDVKGQVKSKRQVE